MSSAYWDTIFQQKGDRQKSWFEEYPYFSVSLIQQQHVGLEAPIIDIGGGDSRLVDALLELGYTNLTVLDISETALQNARERLGERGAFVKWIVADVASFKAPHPYKIWHDRAAFHFVTDSAMQKAYVQNVAQSLLPDGKLIVGTFAADGPEKCSNLPLQRYNEEELKGRFRKVFPIVKCMRYLHQTPFGTTQPFTFCVFQKETHQ